MYEVQITTSPGQYAPWEVLGKFRSLRQARIKAAMPYVPGAPDAQVVRSRVVLTPRSLPVTLREKIYCSGYTDENGNVHHSPECARSAEVVTHWSPGSPFPGVAKPQNWFFGAVCPSCYDCYVESRR